MAYSSSLQKQFVISKDLIAYITKGPHSLSLQKCLTTCHYKRASQLAITKGPHSLLLHKGLTACHYKRASQLVNDYLQFCYFETLTVLCS